MEIQCRGNAPILPDLAPFFVFPHRRVKFAMALAYRRKLERLIVTCLSRLERFFKVDVPERARLGTRTGNFDSDQGIVFAIVSWIFHLFLIVAPDPD